MSTQQCRYFFFPLHGWYKMNSWSLTQSWNTENWVQHLLPVWPPEQTGNTDTVGSFHPLLRRSQRISPRPSAGNTSHPVCLCVLCVPTLHRPARPRDWSRPSPPRCCSRCRRRCSRPSPDKCPSASRQMWWRAAIECRWPPSVRAHKPTTQAQQRRFPQDVCFLPGS